MTLGRILVVDDEAPVREVLTEYFVTEGYAVAGPASHEGIGRFAWTRTPDGHDVELWQP